VRRCIHRAQLVDEVLGVVGIVGAERDRPRRRFRQGNCIEGVFVAKRYDQLAEPFLSMLLITLARYRINSCRLKQARACLRRGIMKSCKYVILQLGLIVVCGRKIRRKSDFGARINSANYFAQPVPG
jgi:ribosomal protein L16/L10AE